MPNTIIKYNDIYEPIFFNKDRYLLLWGGAGSGKSFAIAQKFVVRMLNEHDQRFLFVRKVHRTVRDSMYYLVKSIISSWGLSSYFVTSDNDMRIKFLPKNNMIITAGLDDVEKLKSIAGITSIWIEEATEISHEEFNQLDLRLRDYTAFYHQIVMSFNPISEYHWIKTRFFDNKHERTFSIKSTYKDNAFLPKSYVDTIEALKTQDDTYWKIYGLGEWATIKGLVYTNWDIVEYNVYALFANKNKAYGLDFGYNAPTALIEVSFYDNNNIYAKEIIYQTELTIPELIQLMKEKNISKNDYIYCDSEDPRAIQDLKLAGFTVFGANKSVKEGIEFIRRFKLHIAAESLNLIKEIKTYKFKEKYGELLPEPLKFNDHALDALRYGAYSFGSLLNATLPPVAGIKKHNKSNYTLY